MYFLLMSIICLSIGVNLVAVDFLAPLPFAGPAGGAEESSSSSSLFPSCASTISLSSIEPLRQDRTAGRQSAPPNLLTNFWCSNCFLFRSFTASPSSPSLSLPFSALSLEEQGVESSNRNFSIRDDVLKPPTLPETLLAAPAPLIADDVSE
jgi:hypothetical protein